MPSLCFYGSGGPASWATPEGAQWVERADRYVEPDTVARLWVNLGVGERKALTGLATRQFAMVTEGYQLLIRNHEMARRLGDPEAFWWISGSRFFHVAAPQHAGERLRLAEELAESSRIGVTAVTYGMVLFFIGHVLLESGQRQRAEKFFNEMRGIAERSGQVNLVMLSMCVDGTMATLDGRLEEAMEIGPRIRNLGEMAAHSQLAIAVDILPRIYLGKFNELLQLMNLFPVPIAKVICLAHLGRDAEAVEILEQWVMARPGLGSAEDEFSAAWDVQCLSAAVMVGHRPTAEQLLRRFADCGLRTTGFFMLTCIVRHMGGAAALLGRSEEARKYYEEALKITTEMRFRPEVALTRLQLAELLLEHYPDEKAEALEHLDFAIKESRDMKMQPSLERALRHKEILKA